MTRRYKKEKEQEALKTAVEKEEDDEKVFPKAPDEVTIEPSADGKRTLGDLLSKKTTSIDGALQAEMKNKSTADIFLGKHKVTH